MDALGLGRQSLQAHLCPHCHWLLCPQQSLGSSPAVHQAESASGSLDQAWEKEPPLQWRCVCGHPRSCACAGVGFPPKAPSCWCASYRGRQNVQLESLVSRWTNPRTPRCDAGPRGDADASRHVKTTTWGPEFPLFQRPLSSLLLVSSSLRRRTPQFQVGQRDPTSHGRLSRGTPKDPVHEQ